MESGSDTDSVQHICPAAAELTLDVKTNVTCPVAGCGRVVAQSSALRIHLLKVHKIQGPSDQRFAANKTHGGQKLQAGKPAQEVFYHCPDENCRYHQQQGDRHFPSFKLLKQHYMQIHAEKKYKCPECGRPFSLERLLRRHLKSCGTTFVCATCSAPYSTREAYLTHCHRQQHAPVFPEQSPSMTYTTTDAADKCSKKADSVGVVKPTIHATTMATSTITRCATSPDCPSQTAVRRCPTIYPKPSMMLVKTGGMPCFFLPSIPASPKSTTSNPPVTLLMAPAQPQLILIADARTKRTTTTTSRLRELKTRPVTSSVSSSTVVRSHATSPIPSMPSSGPDSGTTLTEMSKSTDTQTDNCLSARFATRRIGECIPRRDSSRRRNKVPKSTISTQTMSGRGRGRTVAQTQTTGDFILKTAMESADIPVHRESRASQVSPRAKVKRTADARDVSSCETQTAASLRPVAKRRRRPRTISTQRPERLTTGQQTALGNPDVPSVPTATSSSNTTSGTDWSDLPLAHTETQTMAFLERLQASLAESISTQTLESFLAETTGQPVTVAPPQGRNEVDVTLISPMARADAVIDQGQNALCDIFSDLAEPDPGLRMHGTFGQDGALAAAQHQLYVDIGTDPLLGGQPIDYFNHSQDGQEVSGHGDGSYGKSTGSGAARRDGVATHVDTQTSLHGIAFPTNVETQTSLVDCEFPAHVETQTTLTDFDFPANVETQTSLLDLGFPAHVETQTSLTDLDFGVHVESHETHETQTPVTDLGFRELLTSACQTSDMASTAYMNIETQTANDEDENMIEQFLSNMQTQTTHDFLDDLGFSDTETQTPGSREMELSLFEAANVQTQTSATSPFEMPEFAPVGGGSTLHPHAQSAIGHMAEQIALTSANTAQQTETFHHAGTSASLFTQNGTGHLTDTETQTFFDDLDSDMASALTDSHTQTTWDELESLMTQLQ